MNDDIVIIGTDPPCPRCDYLTRMVQDIVAEFQIDATVRHIAYTSEEARRLAAETGLLPGTAKDVAATIAVSVNWDKVYSLLEGLSPGEKQDTCCGSPAQKWSPALDEALGECEVKAEQAGIMMTPVLVVRGEKVHQGCVPGRNQVVEWITRAFHWASEAGEPQNIVEVLGVGCAKCDALYARVENVLARMGMAGQVALRKRADVGYFTQKGVTVTPGLVINGSVVSMGRLPDTEQLSRDIKNNLRSGESNS